MWAAAGVCCPTTHTPACNSSLFISCCGAFRGGLVCIPAPARDARLRARLAQQRLKPSELVTDRTGWRRRAPPVAATISHGATSRRGGRRIYPNDGFRRSAEARDPADGLPLTVRKRSFALWPSDGKVCPIADPRHRVFMPPIRPLRPLGADRSVEWKADLLFAAAMGSTSYYGCRRIKRPYSFAAGSQSVRSDCPISIIGYACRRYRRHRHRSPGQFEPASR